MSGSERGPGGFRDTRRNIGRAVWRMGALETLLLGLIMAVAFAGGAVVAALFSDRLGWSFRQTWFATALLLFLVPAAAHLIRERRPLPKHSDPDITRE